MRRTIAPFRGFNRAQAAVVEAAILVSRLHMLPPDKIEREIGYLADRHRQDRRPTRAPGLGLADGADRRTQGKGSNGAAGMTGFLASVTSAAEAEIVLAAGADIIDLKDPQSGALGALPALVIREAVRAVAGRRTLSATAGDLPMHPQVIADAVDRIAALGVDIVKVGLFAGGDTLACIAAVAKQATRGTRIVAVLLRRPGARFRADRPGA